MSTDPSAPGRAARRCDGTAVCMQRNAVVEHLRRPRALEVRRWLVSYATPCELWPHSRD